MANNKRKYCETGIKVINTLDMPNEKKPGTSDHRFQLTEDLGELVRKRDTFLFCLSS